jgi:hypothetical protein
VLPAALSTALALLLSSLFVAGCTDAPEADPEPVRPTDADTATSSSDEDTLVLGAWHELVTTPDGVLLVNGYPEDEADPGPVELWRRSPDGWEPIEAEDGPGPRNFAGVALDAVSGDLVLHGGLSPDDGVSDETWVYDGAWTLVPGEGPGPRSSAAVAFDEASGRVLLYGGDDGSSQFSDTWAFDGAGWEQVAQAGPQPDRWPAAVESLPGGGVLMYGGHQVEDEEGPMALGGTWLWRDGGWREVAGADQPGPLVNAATAVHPSHGLLLLGGGDLQSRERGRVWRWTGEQWRAMPPGLIPERQAFGAAYDPDDSVVVLTGGLVEPGSTDRYQDTWTWSGDPGAPAEQVG